MKVKYVHKKIGLLGGSFNPAHEGHRHISKQALKLLDLDEVWWLVAPLNPLKSENSMASYERRVQSAEKVANHPQIIVSSIEMEIGTRYTADTVERLQEMFPEVSFIWLMGADNLAQLPLWEKWRKLMHTIPMAVFARKSYALKALHGRTARLYHLYRHTPEHAPLLAYLKPPAWVFLPTRKHPASATELRNKGLFQTGE